MTLSAGAIFGQLGFSRASAWEGWDACIERRDSKVDRDAAKWFAVMTRPQDTRTQDSDTRFQLIDLL